MLYSATPWNRTGDENYIANVVIQFNIISDLGLAVIQSAGIFLCITKSITIERNTIFNGPQAGILFNDLYGGNYSTIGNVMFNLVRLTSQHGTYNVWDRQQWLLPEGFNGWTNTVSENFLLGNPNGVFDVDLDDGSRNHLVTNNIIAYSQVKLKGSNHQAINNVVISDVNTAQGCAYLSNGNFAIPKFSYQRNTCFATSTQTAYYWSSTGRSYCTLADFTTSSNIFYGTKSGFHPCAKSLRVWQKNKRQDLGSKFIRKAPKVATILSACEAMIATWDTSLSE